MSKLGLIIRQIFASERGVPQFNDIAVGDPCQYRYKWYNVKNYILWPTFLPQKVSVYLKPLTQSAQKATESGEIKQPLGLLRRSRSSQVTDFGTNWKLICNFLLVINTNLAPILHRFRDIASERSTRNSSQRWESERELFSTTPLQTRSSVLAERPRCRVRYSFRQK